MDREGGGQTLEGWAVTLPCVWIIFECMPRCVGMSRVTRVCCIFVTRGKW
jgi:hypothetical protein